MPGYYQRSTAGPLPISPPDSGSGYAYSSVPYSHGPYASHPTMSQGRQDAAYDYPQGYLQPSVAPTPSSYQYPQSTYQPANSLPPIQTGFYEPIGAPILPPIRTYDRTALGDDYQHRLHSEQSSAIARDQQQQANNKEEKATGGVSAKLDYEMERMTDFVTDAVQSIFKRSTAHPAFRKWVNQVLSATRLPSATILLSLHYLHHRVMHHPHSVRRDDENQIYRLLAVSLILGSKFLDDNTFINRSWSDVTSIKVAELNMLEMKWLHLINYELHVDLKDVEGLPSWIAAWRKYEAEAVPKPPPQPARLSPLDTGVYRHTTSQASRFSPYPTPYVAPSRNFDLPLSASSSHYSTPYSASDPWSSSSERSSFYSKPQHNYPDYAEIEAVTRRAEERGSHMSSYAYPHSTHPSYYHTPTYSSWDQHTWNGGHRADCNCSTCAYQHHYRSSYAMSSGYAAQTVMG